MFFDCGWGFIANDHEWPLNDHGKVICGKFFLELFDVFGKICVSESFWRSGRGVWRSRKRWRIGRIQMVEQDRHQHGQRRKQQNLILLEHEGEPEPRKVDACAS